MGWMGVAILGISRFLGYTEQTVSVCLFSISQCVSSRD